MGLFDSVSSAVSSVGESISSGVAGVEDVVVGTLEGDTDRAEQGLSDIGSAALTVSTFGQSDLIGDALGGLFGQPEDKSKETGEQIRQKQQELADIQKEEAIRLQQEQATVARRNIFRQRIAQDIQTQAAQAASAARASGGGFFSSVAAQEQAAISQAGAATAFGAQFGQSEVERQLAANVQFIETTAGLGQELSELGQTFAEQQQAAAQQAAGVAGILQGAVTGAGVGASFGPQGAVVGGVLGAAAGGAGSGAFSF